MTVAWRSPSPEKRRHTILAGGPPNEENRDESFVCALPCKIMSRPCFVAKIDAIWPAGDPRTGYPDLAIDDRGGERVVLVNKRSPADGTAGG
jgi:hypothetical protein